MIILVLVVVMIAASLSILTPESLTVPPGGIENQPIEPLQVASLIVIIAILTLLYLEYRDDKENWRWLLPMAVWMIFGLTFYGLLFADRYLQFQIVISYTNLSGVLRWYGYITLFLVEYFRWMWHRIKLGKTPDPIYQCIERIWKKVFHRRGHDGRR